jgi:Fic family protein
MAIRNAGDWEGWLKFFFRGVAEVAERATETARAIVTMRESLRSTLDSSPNALRLLDYLFRQPILNVRMAEEYLGVTFPTAGSAMAFLVEKNVLVESTGQRRNRIYRFERLLEVFAQQMPVPSRPETRMLTET